MAVRVDGSGTPRSRLLRGAAGIAVAMAVMNLTTYGFQIVAARALGPREYGAVAGLMALLLVLTVAQLGLQATAARRVAADPAHAGPVERAITVLSLRSALILGAVLLVASPVVAVLLRLDSVLPAALLAVATVPMTLLGGAAGILQGERRWPALAAVYLALGLSRLLLGTVAIVVRPTVTMAMLGVTVAMLAPAAVSLWAVHRPLAAARRPALSPDAERPAVHGLTREAAVSALALLAFFVLSNVDIVIARQVLDDHAAGLYAAGLIVAKAVLFLPQFVVVLAFPSLSSPQSRRRALSGGLLLVLVLGGACVVGTLVLPDLALAFAGGEEYADVRSRLWLFSVLGTLLAGLQMLVYSVLARRSAATTWLVWAAVVAIAGGAAALDSVTALVVFVSAVDAVLLALLVVHAYRGHRASRPDQVTADFAR